MIAQTALVGFTEPKGSRAGLGALHLAVQGDGGLVYAGRVGTGFNDRLLTELREALEGAERPTPPQPWTATHWPGAVRPWTTTARQAVVNRHPKLAAATASTSSGNGTRLWLAWRIITRSANEPQWVNPGCS